MDIHDFIQKTDVELLLMSKTALRSVYGQCISFYDEYVYVYYKKKRHRLLTVAVKDDKYTANIIEYTGYQYGNDVKKVPLESLKMENIREFACKIADCLILPKNVQQLFDKVKGKPFLWFKPVKGTSPVILKRFISKDVYPTDGKRTYWIFETEENKVVSLCEANFKYHLTHNTHNK